MSEYNECNHTKFEFCICTGCNKDVLEIHEEQKERIADLEARLADSVVMPEFYVTEERLYSIVDALFHEFASDFRTRAKVSLAIKIAAIRKALSEGK